MNKSFFYICALLTVIFFTRCHDKSETNHHKIIDYGKPTTSYTIADIIDKNIDFIKLETTKDCIIGYIDQIEIVENNIYILDSWISKSLYAFNTNGKFITKIAAGAAPEEFIIPYNFYIDKEKKTIMINDIDQNKIVEYNLDNLQFISNKTTRTGYNAIHRIPLSDLYAIYKPALRNTDKQDSQIYITDANILTTNKTLEAEPKSCILSGKNCNFYQQDSTLVMYPFFSNILYNVEKDTTAIRYELRFGDKTFPPIDFFKDLNWGTIAICDQLRQEEYISRIEPYETHKHLITKYKIKDKDYLGIYNKDNNKTVTISLNDIKDDLSIGGFPPPVYSDDEKITGLINTNKLLENKENIENKHLRDIINMTKEEDNPILAIYKITTN